MKADSSELVTAREAAGVCGLSPDGSAHATYRRLVLGEVVDAPEDPGFLAQACIRWYMQEQLLEEIHRPPLYIRHPKHSFIGALPDALVPGEEVGVDVENPAPWAEDWGKPGTDQIPASAFIRGVVGMACTDRSFWQVIAPLGGRLCVYPLRRDPKIERVVIGRLEEFWEKHVLPKVIPELSHSQTDRGWISSRFKFDRGQYLQLDQLTPGVLRTLDALERAHRAIAVEENAKDAAINQLKEVIGEHSGIEWNGKRVDWKKNRPSQVVNWEAVARGLAGILALEKDLSSGETPLEALILEHTSFIEGSRPFVPRLGKGQL